MTSVNKLIKKNRDFRRSIIETADPKCLSIDATPGKKIGDATVGLNEKFQFDLKIVSI